MGIGVGKVNYYFMESVGWGEWKCECAMMIYYFGLVLVMGNSMEKAVGQLASLGS